MGCCCSVLGMIKQWGWIRALSYDKHMHTHIDAHTHIHTQYCVSPSESTCLSMDGVDCTALTHPRLHVEPRGASDWHGDTNGVEQESCWEWQISGCGDAAEVYVGSGSRPSALSFDLQWGTAFDVLIISLNRAQGGWGKESKRGGGEGRGEARGYAGRHWGKPKDVSPVWAEDPRQHVCLWMTKSWLALYTLNLR